MTTERRSNATIVLNAEDYEYLLAVLAARATQDKYQTNYEILALVEKIEASKAYHNRKDRTHAI